MDQNSIDRPQPVRIRLWWRGRALAHFTAAPGQQIRRSLGRCGKEIGTAEGNQHHRLEMEPPHRLVFTWTSEGVLGVANSIVTIELKELGKRTELTLTHNVDPASAQGQAHARGWLGTLGKLEHYLREAQAALRVSGAEAVKSVALLSSESALP